MADKMSPAIQCPHNAQPLTRDVPRLKIIGGQKFWILENEEKLKSHIWDFGLNFYAFFFENSILFKFLLCQIQGFTFKSRFLLFFCIFWKLIPFSQSICTWSANQGQKWAVCQEQRNNGGIQGQGCLVSRSSYILESLKALHFDLERAHEVVLGLVMRV